MKRRAEKFDSFDTNVGKYSSRKVPKWSYNSNDLVEYLSTYDEEALPIPDGWNPQLSS